MAAQYVTLGDTNNNKGDEVMGNQYKLEKVNNHGGNIGEGNTLAHGRHNKIALPPARAAGKIKGAR